MDLHSGKFLHNGKYLLGESLGAEGISATYRAVMMPRNQTVVIKSLRQHAFPTDFAPLKRQFLSDAQKLSQCHHPGLVKILEIFEEEGLPYVVMDFIPGENLADWIQTCGPLPETKALQYVRQVASALNALHQKGLLHLDVKPQNMVRPPTADFVVLIDFGFAHAAIATAQLATSSQPLVDYIALEQYRPAQPITPATDIYALAASLYHLVTGQPPLSAPLRNRAALVSPRHIQPQISPALETAICRGMEMNASARPQTLAIWFALLPPQPTAPSQTRGAQVSAAPPPTAQPPAARPNSTPLPPPSPSPQRPNPDERGPHSPGSPSPVVMAGMPAAPVAGGVKTAVALPNVNPNIKPKVKLAPTAALDSASSPADFTRKQSQAEIAPLPRFPSPTLMKISAIAALLGLIGGLVLRLSGGTGPGSQFFHTDQAFPKIQDWQGIAEPTAPPAAPPLTNQIPRPTRQTEAPGSKPGNTETAQSGTVKARSGPIKAQTGNSPRESGNAQERSVADETPSKPIPAKPIPAPSPASQAPDTVPPDPAPALPPAQDSVTPSLGQPVAPPPQQLPPPN
jgi:serine/threonine protein kinase